MIKIVNLDPEFDPYSVSNSKTELTFDFFVFKGGEPSIKFNCSWASLYPNVGDSIYITHRIHSFESVGKLMVAVDALNRLGYYTIHLVLPYFPGARQDRLMVPGEAMTSAVYVKILENLKFKSILSFDLHSDVVPGMFSVLTTRFVNNTASKFFLEAAVKVSNGKNVMLVSPDRGYEKKMKEFVSNNSTAYGYFDFIEGDKTRDVTNGNITGFKVYTDDLSGRDCLIMDDICDGGGTFIGLAKALKDKGAGKLYLAVTHAIFSKGTKELLEHFEEIHFTDSFNPYKYTEGVISKKLNQHNIKLYLPL